ncbi:MAG: hypothetical protein WA001_03195 [Patescibacteria group bacterium]
MPSKQLPGVGQLLRDSWHFFITQWNETLKITVWFLYIGLLEFALALLLKVSPFFALIYLPAELGILALSLWVAVRTIQVVMQLEAGKKATYSKTTTIAAWKLVLPLVWVAILEILIIMGGLIVVIIPGIYLAVVLSFSTFFLVDEGERGLAALNKSRALVKGRFWPTLWRMFGGMFILGFGLLVLVEILFGLLSLLAGPHFIISLQAQDLDPMVQGTLSLFQAIIQAAVIPLIIGYQVKLYRALKKTQ